MPTAHFPTPEWRTSSHSGQSGQCVEVADLTAAVAVRDSKDPDGGILQLDRAAFAALAGRICQGDLDL